jgi:hypothetical protein
MLAVHQSDQLGFACLQVCAQPIDLATHIAELGQRVEHKLLDDLSNDLNLIGKFLRCEF